jgi:tRNA pseudouridine55 synthase
VSSPTRRTYRDVNGILLLDKPVGITSNRALQMVKRLLQARKAGHTGSLDPLASGMLPLCFGQATKVSHWLLGADKIYEVEALIGSRTDTADADGEVTESSDKVAITAAELEAAIASHLGEIDQIPPMYSALKKDGKRLYELAREGKVVDRPARKVRIHSIDIVRFDPQRPILRVSCSKGTYIRTLVETLAAAAGTLAHVVALRRVGLGSFDPGGMISMERVEELALNPVDLERELLAPDSALVDFPVIQLSSDEAFYLCNGHPVGHASPEISGLTRVYGPEDRFLGIGEVLPDGRIAPKRLFTGT